MKVPSPVPGPLPGGPTVPSDEDRQLVDAFIAASRALVAVAARSLADLGADITLPQYRALVVLYTRGPQRSADLAGWLEVNPSTASRMIDRLVRKRLIRRHRLHDDRRAVRIHLTEAGRDIVARVTERRRAEIEAILEHLPTDGRAELAAALHCFAEAAGEAPGPDWSHGWDS